MLKAFFIVGQCIRLFHTDPWQVPTFRIDEVGKYSYNTSELTSFGQPYVYGKHVITFDEQQSYETIDCPKPKE